MTGKLDAVRQNRDALVRELEAVGAKVTTGGMLCPFHEDHRPSAGVYQGKDGAWRFKCQACGVCEDIFGVRAKALGKPLAKVLLEASPHAANPSSPTRARTGHRPAGRGKERVYRDIGRPPGRPAWSNRL